LKWAQTTILSLDCIYHLSIDSQHLYIVSIQLFQFQDSIAYSPLVDTLHVEALNRSRQLCHTLLNSPWWPTWRRPPCTSFWNTLCYRRAWNWNWPHVKCHFEDLCNCQAEHMSKEMEKLIVINISSEFYLLIIYVL